MLSLDAGRFSAGIDRGARSMIDRRQQQADCTAQALEHWLDRAYLRVLGMAYQVLGDAELAARAAEQIFLQQPLPADEQQLWKRVLRVMDAFIARGFVVHPPVAPDGGQAALLRALASLAPRERALLLLRYHERFSIEDLAALLDVPPAAARQRVAAARSRLLEALHRS